MTSFHTVSSSFWRTNDRSWVGVNTRRLVRPPMWWLTEPGA